MKVQKGIEKHELKAKKEEYTLQSHLLDTKEIMDREKGM